MIVIDIKCTIWERYNLPDNVDIEEIKKQLSEGISPECIFENLKIENVNNEILYDTIEEMLPEENEGNSTIELFDDIIRDPIWTNSTLTKDNY